MQISKNKDFSEWYNTILKEAQLCDLRYGLKGFVVFMPWSVMTMEKMYAAYEKELQAHDHVPAWFPALIPKNYIVRESEHVEGFVPEVFWVTEAGREKLEEPYAMRPTSETAMYPMYALWIKGLKDLPFKLYQRAQVWRHETKATKPFIRSREFHWIEAHNCFATRAQAMAQVREDMEMAEQVLHVQWGIPFLFFQRPQWDKFAGAEDTYAADTLLPDGKVLQLPSTHMLGQNFSKAFGVRYTDEKGSEQLVWQTCYGPAISRIYAALIATHGDDTGLVFPLELAPVQVVVVPIYKGGNKAKVDAYCKSIRAMLPGWIVRLDDSENTPGFKYNIWEMKGVPIRIEAGERDIAENGVVVVRRGSREKHKVLLADLDSRIRALGAELATRIRSTADSRFQSLQLTASTMEQLKIHLDAGGGFVRVPFCSDRMESEACAGQVKQETHGNMRGSRFGDSMKPSANEVCIACGKPATIYLYAARQY